MTIRYYIGINDDQGSQNVEIVEAENSRRLEEVIQDRIRACGNLASLLLPITDDPHFAGYSRLTITVGPPEECHPCSHCGEVEATVDLCEDCGCCDGCCRDGLGEGDCHIDNEEN